MSFAPILSAQHSTLSQQIIDQLNNGQASSAYQLARKNQYDYEGDVEFDFAFGLAAKASGHLNQAVFAFERVLQNAPNAFDARLALAVCYYEIGNLSAAETELRKLDEHNALDSNLRETVTQYLQAIQQQNRQLNQQLKMTVTLGFGQDSNPNNGVEDSFVDIPALGRVTFFPESIEQSSGFGEVKGAISYVHPINQHTSWQISGSIYHAEYDKDAAYDRTFGSLNGGYQTRIDDVDVYGSIFYQSLRLNDQDYLDYYGGQIGANYGINSRNTIGVDFSVSQEDASDELAFDRNQYVAKAWIGESLSSGNHRFTLQYGLEESKDDRRFLDREIYGAGYSWRHQLTQKWNYRIDIDFLKSEYDDVNPLFNEVRADKYWSAELNMEYAIAKSFSLLGKVSFVTNESAISIYEHQRSKGWIGVRYEF